MFRDEPPESRRAEHLALGVVGLDQPVAVEQDAVSLSQEVPTLFVAHAGHQAEEMKADLMDRLGIADLLRPATADEETR